MGSLERRGCTTMGDAPGRRVDHHVDQLAECVVRAPDRAAKVEPHDGHVATSSTKWRPRADSDGRPVPSRALRGSGAQDPVRGPSCATGGRRRDRELLARCDAAARGRCCAVPPGGSRSRRRGGGLLPMSTRLPAQPADTWPNSGDVPGAVKRSPAGPDEGRREAVRLTGTGRRSYPSCARAPSPSNRAEHVSAGAPRLRRLVGRAARAAARPSPSVRTGCRPDRPRRWRRAWARRAGRRGGLAPYSRSTPCSSSATRFSPAPVTYSRGSTRPERLTAWPLTRCSAAAVAWACPTIRST